MRRAASILFLLFVFQNSTAQNVSYSDTNDLMSVVSPGGLGTNHIFTEVAAFHEGICWVNKGDLYGYLDTNLNELTDFVYTAVANFKNHFAIVSRDSLCGFINQSGHEIVELKYHQCRNFDGGFASVMCDSLWGLVNASGNLVHPCEFDFPPFSCAPGFIIACRNFKWGVLGTDLSILYPFNYDFINSQGVAYLGEAFIILGAR